MSDIKETDAVEKISLEPKKVEAAPRKPNPVLLFLSAIPRVIFSGIAYLLHPKRLKLSKLHAEYVQELFLGGSSPEDVGRSMNNLFGRMTWKYFQVFNAQKWRYEWPIASEDGEGRVDFEIDGLEYINAALWALGGVVKGYYNPNHPMVKKIAEYAGKQEPPKRKGV